MSETLQRICMPGGHADNPAPIAATVLATPLDGELLNATRLGGVADAVALSRDSSRSHAPRRHCLCSQRWRSCRRERVIAEAEDSESRPCGGRGGGKHPNPQSATTANAALSRSKRRELLRCSKERVLPALLAHPGTRPLHRRRVHRGVLQPAQAALHPRLPDPVGSPTDQRTAAAAA